MILYAIAGGLIGMGLTILIFLIAFCLMFYERP
jgi:hypothetical protein